MDKYKKLMSNTLIFAIGTFSSKFLSFLMLPYYTHVLEPSELGNGDLLFQAANFLIPVVSIGISNAIIRYGLDKHYRKSDVFTGAICAIFAGYLLFLFWSPLLNRIPFNEEVRSNFYLIYFYVLTSSLRSLCSQFVRARQLVRFYAFDGMLSTVTVVLFNVIFLSVFKLGVPGYVLSTICSDFLSACFLFGMAGLRKYINFAHMEWHVLGNMLRFSIPLIPTSIFWWITNVSDRYMLTIMLENGDSINGLYGVSYKIPTMINLVSSIFSDAWQMSAITENGPGRDKFYTKIFSAYSALLFTTASGLILFAKLFISILASEKYYQAWTFVPFLVISVVFSCLVTFLGSIYMVEKKSGLTLATTILGAIINVILNILLIPKYEANGAAFATFASYLAVFLFRIINTHHFVRIRWNPLKVLFNSSILIAQAWVLLTIPVLWKWILYESLLCLLMILFNMQHLLMNLQHVLARHSRPRSQPH